jgi:hypothetical protein
MHIASDLRPVSKKHITTLISKKAGPFYKINFFVILKTVKLFDDKWLFEIETWKKLFFVFVSSISDASICHSEKKLKVRLLISDSAYFNTEIQ